MLPVLLLLPPKYAKINMRTMMRHTHRQLVIVAAIVMGFALIGLVSSSASADYSASSNYQVNETFFGTGGELNASSTNYSAKQSVGELTVGAIRSTIYSAQAGFNTNREPYIAIATLTPSVDVGVLDVSSVKYGSAQFWVRAYLASGYVVQAYGGPPKITNHTLATSSSLFGSTPGTEQFGINLAVNTSPSVGAAPTQYPDNTGNPFGFGAVSSNYATPNQFRYIDGDTIAYSTRSSSDTTYTISYIFNISPVTPAGTYTMQHSIVATATY